MGHMQIFEHNSAKFLAFAAKRLKIITKRRALPAEGETGMDVDAGLGHEVRHVATRPCVVIDIAVTLVHSVEEVVELAFERNVRAALEALQRKEILQIQIGHGIGFQHRVPVFVVGKELLADDGSLNVRVEACVMEREDVSRNPVG